MTTGRAVTITSQLPANDGHENPIPLPRAAHEPEVPGNALLSAGWQAFDLLGIGVMLCTGRGQCVFSNRIARRILSRHAGLELSPSGILRAGPASRHLLRTALQKASENTRSIREYDSSFAIRRLDGKWALRLLVRSVKQKVTAGARLQPTALVLILELQSRVKMTDEDLHQLYGLTSAESRLANLLCEGNTLRECCSHLRICDATARTHLKRLFKKTRTRRQYELVSLLLKSLGLARLGQQDGNALGSTIPTVQSMVFEQLARTLRQPGALRLPESIVSQVS